MIQVIEQIMRKLKRGAEIFHTQVDIKLPFMNKQWKINYCHITIEATIYAISKNLHTCFKT